MTGSVDAAYFFMISLLYDEALRSQFAQSRTRTLAQHGVPPAFAASFLTLDLKALKVDAALRRRYLMSALCRPFPLTCGVLGSDPEGAERLSAFMASASLTQVPGLRSIAFAEFLNTLIDGDEHCGGPEFNSFLKSFLAWERALVLNAQAIREVVKSGGRVPPPKILHGLGGKLGLPAHTVAAILPCSPSTLTLALQGLSAGDCWQRIEGRTLNFQRVVAVARARPSQVTVLARGIIKNQSDEKIVEGVVPLVDVSHVTAELAGNHGAFLSRMDGTQNYEELPPSQKAFAHRLLEVGLLDIGL